MPNYRRLWIPGGTYFFTVNLADRNCDLLIRHIESLRTAVRDVRAKYPFSVHAWVVLPEHMHCVIELPADDADYATRWRLIKRKFSVALPPTEWRSDVRRKRGERGIWQRRYWEHLVRDEADLQAHLDYVHINPLKHGLVSHVRDWPHSTFHRLVKQGIYPDNWADESRPVALSYDD